MSEHDLPEGFDGTSHVERTDIGVSITTELKRGTGTRDQDKHVIKAKGYTLDDACDKHAAALAYLETEVLEDVRAMQPGAESVE